MWLTFLYIGLRKLLRMKAIKVRITLKRMKLWKILKGFRTLMLFFVECLVLITTKTHSRLALMLARGGSMVDV
jgi:hypothetical protein